MDSALQELIEHTSASAEVEAILKLRDGQPPPPGVKIVSQFGPIATCRVQPQWLAESEHEGVESVEVPRLVNSEPLAEVSREEDGGRNVEDAQFLRLPREVTGRGVVVAILDWGCDFAHPNFLNDDGTTRLIALWDQSARAPSDNRYGYGQIYPQADINRALAANDPYRALGYHPAKSDPFGSGTHGTAVMDIAAGNGRSGSRRGIAPEADLIFVHLDASPGTSGLLANLGDSVRLLEALDFVARTAEEQPWVANLSLGRTGGDHTGESLVEQGMDELLLATPGCAIGLSTGNYFQTDTHASDRLFPGEERRLGWLVDPADVTPNELEVWYSTKDRFRVSLRPPGESAAFTAALGERVTLHLEGKAVGKLYHSDYFPTGDRHIDIFLYPEAPKGRWEVSLTGEQIRDGRFHSWIERDMGRSTNQSRFERVDAVSRYTTGTICNGKYTLAVGAYDPWTPDWNIAPFSSSGPTRQETLKPDLLAPGCRIPTIRSTPEGAQPTAHLTASKTGTSFATPHVTGAIALLFAAVPRKLKIEETRSLLLDNADKAIGKDPFRSGNGYLNIERMLDAARQVEHSDPAANNLEITANRSTEEETMIDDDTYLTDEALTESGKRNFILISGGPGEYKKGDPEHDTSWANYVTAPLLLTDTPAQRQRFAQADEEVWWFVYKPAHERRWEKDSRSEVLARKAAVQDVKDKGFTSYVNLIEGRARSRGWNLRWLTKADDLWTKLETFNDPISRVWYWGHARNDLWLSIRHGVKDKPIAPEPHEIITIKSIEEHSYLRDRFQRGDHTKVHRFVGCNTEAFAQSWSKTFDVWAEGIEGKVDFGVIHQTGGEPCLVSSAQAKLFYLSGTQAPSYLWSSSLSKCQGGQAEAESADIETEDELAQPELFEQRRSPDWNAYVYVVGTDRSGGGDFNVMRHLLQSETAYEYPWLAITFDFKNREIRRSSKRSRTDSRRDRTQSLGSNFEIVYEAIERMPDRNIQIKHLHFLTHFGNDRIYYQGIPNRDLARSSSTVDLKARDRAKLRAAFAADAVVKIHGCQQDRSLETGKFCASDTSKQRDILQKVRDRIGQSYPYLLASLLHQPVWATPMGAYAIYECSYLPQSERGKRFCVESESTADHSFHRTLRFYQANYEQIFARGSEEAIFDRTYHLKYKPQLIKLNTLSPLACQSRVFEGGIEDEAETDELEPTWTFAQQSAAPLAESLTLCEAINPAQLYDRLRFGEAHSLPLPLADRLAIVGYPGEHLAQPLQAGDLIVRRALGEANLGHAAVVATSELWRSEQVADAGLLAEGNRPGWYVQVVEQGWQPHDYADSFARLALDASGRVPPNQLLLRPQQGQFLGSSVAETIPSFPFQLVCEYNRQQRSRWETVRNKMVRIATEEFQVTWRSGANRETTPAMRQVIENYWRQGVFGGAAVPGYINVPGSAWSAAFIAWVVNQAGGGDRFSKVHDEANYRQGFRPLAHWRYVAPSKLNREMPSQINPFWAFAINEQTPQPGDIVVKGRNGSGATYNAHQGRVTHGDIVVDVNRAANQITVIGGNSGPGANTVFERTVPLDAGGFVQSTGGANNDHFAIVRINTDIFNLPFCNPG